MTANWKEGYGSPLMTDILGCLKPGGWMTPAEIKKRLGRDGTSVNTALSALYTKGKVNRRRSPQRQNHLSWEYTLTP